MVRNALLLFAAFSLFASLSDSNAGPPRRGAPGGVGYSEHQHRPYYYRRYNYAPVHRPPVHFSRFPHR